MFRKLIFRCLATLIVTLSMGLTAFGQTLVVKGKVTESPSGDILPGVNVVEINSNDRQVNGVNCDPNGNYTLHISDPNNRIRFSYIGLKTVIEPINGRTVINVRMEGSGRELTEVVITGKKEDRPSIGVMNIAKRDLISSVASIKSDAFDKEPIGSLDQLIQGRVSGVQVIAESGDPGAGAEVRIRGIADINGNSQPLYVIDGIPIISEQNSTDNGGARINPIADINMADIERMDILKDGNATALYGSRAANGVVLITTKRGKKGVTNISFKYQLGATEQPKPIPVLDAQQYKSMQLEGLQGSGFINPLNNSNVRPFSDDPSYEAYRYYQNNTNWFQGIMRTGIKQNYNLSVSGGGESATYNFTSMFNNETGTLIGTGVKNFTTRFNLEYKISSKFRLNTNVYFARTRREQLYNVEGGTVYQIALTRSPLLPIYDIDSKGNQLDNYFSLPGNQNQQDNPVAVVNTTSNFAYGTNLKPNIQAELEVKKNLRWKTTASLDFLGENGVSFYPAEASGLIWNAADFNKLENRDSERRQLILSSALNYTKDTKNFRSFFSLSTEYQKTNSNNMLSLGFATANEQTRSFGAIAGTRRIDSRINDDGILRQYGMAQTIYKDRYSLNLVVSRDGVSKFGDNNKYGLFPSVGGFWRPSSEPFLRNSKVINDLKVRFSYGVNGNSGGLGQYDYLSQFSTGNSYSGLVGVAQNNPQLTKIKWSSSLKRSLGVELRMFNRFDMTFELYENKTIDMLYNQAVPTTSGINGSSLKVNLGDLSNRGVELDLAYDVFKSKKSGGFNWNSSFNISRNQNLLTRLPGGTLIQNGQFGYQSQLKQGDPLGTYYGLVYKGVYPTDADAAARDVDGNIVYELDGVTPRVMRIKTETGNPFRGGDAIYEDFNHDGIINDQDKVKIGNAMPDFYGGMSNRFSFKNFTLNTLCNFQIGNDLINGMRYNLERMATTSNQAASVLNRWRTQGDITNIPRALSAPGGGTSDDRNYMASTRWLENGSYLRLSSLSIGYTFPSALAKRMMFRNLNMFFTANRLLTWTKYTGADPEVGLGNGLGLMGVDGGWTNPRTKSYLLGVNFSL